MSVPIHFVVPVKPVGVNASYVRRSMRRGGKGLRKTDAAKVFSAAIAAAGRLARAGVETLDGPVSVTLAIFFADERPDIDGPLKPILDAMQSSGAGIYSNDRQVRRLLVERDADRDRPRIEVWVEPFRRRVLPLLGLDEEHPAAELERVRGLVSTHRDRIDESVAVPILGPCVVPMDAPAPLVTRAAREPLTLRAPNPDADLRRQLAVSRRMRSSKVDYR